MAFRIFDKMSPMRSDYLRTLFRVGPVLMLVPVVLWAAAWNLSLSGENQGWYIVQPMNGLLITAALWHLALIALDKNRLLYLAYAVAFLPVFYLVWNVALALATHFPL